MEHRERGQLHECRHEVRRHVASYERCCRSRRRLAEKLALPESTLRRWCATSMSRAVLGRPTSVPSAEEMTALRGHLLDAAAHVSVRDLRARFPGVARRILASELRRVRADLRRARRARSAQLVWHRPGSVWAADFTQLGGRRGDSALLVRDLASGKVLDASIARAQSADVVVDALARLVREYGAPLVLKTDNGSAFVAESTRAALRAHSIAPLYSPPRTPAYNGACERSVGVLKSVAVDLRTLEPARPMDAHLRRAARLISQRSGSKRASPDELWAQRLPIPGVLRARFIAHCRAAEMRVREARGIAAAMKLEHPEQSKIGRVAIRDALRELDLLTIRRR